MDEFSTIEFNNIDSDIGNSTDDTNDNDGLNDIVDVDIDDSDDDTKHVVSRKFKIIARRFFFALIYNYFIFKFGDAS